MVVFQHVLRFVCLFWPPLPFTQCCFIPLSLLRSLGCSWTRLLGTIVVFLSSLHFLRYQPLPSWTMPPPPQQKKMEPPFQHTRPTNCLIFLQRISCPTFLSVHCAVKRMQACTRLSSLIEAGSYLTAVTTYDYRCDAALLDLSRWFQPASLICLKFHSKWGCLQGFLVRSDLMAAHKDGIVWQPWVTPDGWIHKAEIFTELHRLPICN